jgi:splicing factor 45
MVGPGEVDPDLAAETKEECTRYGPVRKVVVRELQGVPEDEAVWTFVAFEKQESAVGAYRAMSGRFFGGRRIGATFFDEGKFDRGELLPQ